MRHSRCSAASRRSTVRGPLGVDRPRCRRAMNRGPCKSRDFASIPGTMELIRRRGEPPEKNPPDAGDISRTAIPFTHPPAIPNDADSYIAAGSCRYWAPGGPSPALTRGIGMCFKLAMLGASPNQDKGPRGSPFPISAGFDQSGESQASHFLDAESGEKGFSPARRDGAEIGNMGASEDSSPLFSKLFPGSSQLPKPHTGMGLVLCRGHPPTSSRRVPHPSSSECLFLGGSQCFVTRSSDREMIPTM